MNGLVAVCITPEPIEQTLYKLDADRTGDLLPRIAAITIRTRAASSRQHPGAAKIQTGDLATVLGHPLDQGALWVTSGRQSGCVYTGRMFRCAASFVNDLVEVRSVFVQNLVPPGIEPWVQHQIVNTDTT